MSGAKLNADGRLGMLLTELRLPTIVAITLIAAAARPRRKRHRCPARRSRSAASPQRKTRAARCPHGERCAPPGGSGDNE